MKKIYFLLIFLCGIALFSCNENETETQLQDDYEVIALGDLFVDPILSTRSGDLPRFSLTYVISEQTKGLTVSIAQTDENRYLCDANNDNIGDFFMTISPIEDTANSFEIIYEDVNQKNLQKANVCITGSQAIFDVIEIYSTQTRALFGDSDETWSECFSRRMGSTSGIIMTIGAGFLGPEGSAAVAVGGALSCLIYS